MRAGLLFSGGMDSTTLLWEICKREIFDEVLVFSFDYESCHAQKELHASKEIFKKASECFSRISIKHKIIHTPFAEWGFRSGLLSTQKNIPDGHYEEKSMEKTIVPFRNGIMLSIVTGLLEEGVLFYGGHAGDHAIYPDCRSSFASAMGKAILEGIGGKVSLETPFIKMTKRDIALLGRSLEAPIALSWSCYKGGAAHCGTCGTCTERKEALEGFDETEYLV